MKIHDKTTLRELAFIVGTALSEARIDAVLSGGGAAGIYAPEAVQSRDLDFILSFWSSLDAPAKCLFDLGFREKGGIYSHPDTSFTIEFPQGPLMIGEEVITSWATLREGRQVLQVLTPTDCVRDRLSWFLFYNSPDYSALEQALAVAMQSQVDVDAVRTWAEEHGAGERFRIFEARLHKARRQDH